MQHTYFRIIAGLGSVGGLIAAIHACGGTTSSSPGSSGEGGAGGGTSGGLSSSCPTTVPADHSACSGAGLECEYGSDPSLACNTTATCAGGTWSVGAPGAAPACPTVLPAQCPASPAASAPAAACSNAGARCTYPTGECVCAKDCGPRYPVAMTCDAATPLTWNCRTTQSGCPASRPHLGEACAAADLRCSYAEEPCEATNFVCKDGTWHSEHTPCAISTAKAKKEIHYLDDAELERISTDTNALRLTTYRYKEGDPAEHLGFIIEDAPQSHAVIQGRDRVDLYSYTSMAIATLQVQQRELATLRREVGDLRKQVAAQGRTESGAACTPDAPRHPGDNPRRP